MTQVLTLMERLSGVQPEAGLSPEQVLSRSIARRIASMLTSRQGSARTLPDYGLPDLNHCQKSFHDLVNQTADHIKHMIQCYEKRLKKASVVYCGSGQKNQLQLSFAISGTIEINGISSQINFTADLHRGGKIFLR